MADLAVLQAREAQQMAAIADLRVAQQARRATATLSEPAMRAGADERWEHWIAQRLTIMNADLAQLRVRIVHERRRVQQAFGRREALAALVARAQAARLQQRTRLSERET